MNHHQKEKNIYQIHDNGGIPYFVEIDGEIMECVIIDNYGGGKEIVKLNYEKIFVGNTILLHIKNNLFI